MRNMEPPAKLKMANRGLKIGRRGLERGLTIGYWPFPTAEQVRILPRYLAMLHATPYVDQSDYLPDSSVGLEGGLGFKHSVNIGYWPFRATFAK